MNDGPGENAPARAEPVLQRRTQDGVAVLTLDRPRQYNALSRAMLDALHRELDAVAGDDSVRVLIITGAGRAFCSGHDLPEMRAMRSHRAVHPLFPSRTA